MEVNFPSADWLRYLKTQLNVFKLWAEFVCEARKSFKRRFLETIFSLKGDTKELQVKENLFDCPQIWTVATIMDKSS